MKHNRWWRDYEQECAAWNVTAEGKDYGLLEARSSEGIHIRVKLYKTRPMYNATFQLT